MPSVLRENAVVSIVRTPEDRSRIGVFGAGAWGTALASTFSQAHQVTLWTREDGHAEEMRASRTNERYLSGIRLPDALNFSEDFEHTAREADLHLIVTPLAGLRETVRNLARIAPGVPLLWACKGVESDTARLAHEIVHEERGNAADCGVLTGPSFAQEVAAGLPGAIALASRDIAFARHWVARLHQPRLRLYANDDVIGCELGGALKNVIAIAAGIADAQGFGLNARAALITRGLAEIARLGVALGAQRNTLMGLAGMGDLILTCTGDLSRNRRVGLGLGEGRSLDEILTQLGHVAEGVPCSHAAVLLARRHSVELPICETVAELLTSPRPDPRAAVERLLAREPREEE